MDQHDLKQLYNNVWFSKLPLHFQEYLIKHSSIRLLDKDQAVFYTGDYFDGLYAVIHGSIRLGYIDIEGNQAVSAIVEPIMWFGEISLVDQQPRSHDAVCMQNTTILHISASEIDQLIQQHPEFWFHIAQLTNQKLRFAFLELISIQTQNIQQRLAQRLLFILNGYGNHLQIENNSIHLSQEQLAQMLVCSRQTINQELQHLEKQGLLKLAFKRIEILDVENLHTLAHKSMIKQH